MRPHARRVPARDTQGDSGHGLNGSRRALPQFRMAAPAVVTVSDRDKAFWAKRAQEKTRRWAGFFMKTGTDLLSPVETTIGPAGFTSEFGMGSGVGPPAKAPAKPGDGFHRRRADKFESVDAC